MCNMFALFKMVSRYIIFKPDFGVKLNKVLPSRRNCMSVSLFITLLACNERECPKEPYIFIMFRDFCPPCNLFLRNASLGENMIYLTIFSLTYFSSTTTLFFILKKRWWKGNALYILHFCNQNGIMSTNSQQIGYHC